MENNDNLQSVYLEQLNSYVIPKIDFEKLGKSYKTDFLYAKEILQAMTSVFKDIYGTDRLYCDDEIEFVDVPAVIRSRGSGNIIIGLVNLDLQSSGEHWGTDFVTENGIVSSETDRSYINSKIGFYDYWYAIPIYGDIHVDMENIPREIAEILDINDEQTFEQKM